MDPACCCDPRKCDNCSDSKLSVGVTLASITECAACWGSNPYGKWISSPSVGPNGMFALTAETPFAITCVWSYSVACTGQLKYYSDASCTTNTVTLDLTTFNVELLIGAATQVLLAWYEQDSFEYPVSSGTYPSIGAFFDSIAHTGAPSPVACFPKNFTNDYAACIIDGLTQSAVGFTGGTGASS